MTLASRRVSVNDEAPPLLFGGLPPPLMKLLTAAFLLYSSSTSRLFLLRTNKKIPPAIAAMATMPTTTPAAMPALLGDPLDFAEAEDEDSTEEPAVTTMVDPGWVTTDGAADLVEEGVDAVELSAAVETELLKPVR